MDKDHMPPPHRAGGGLRPSAEAALTTTKTSTSTRLTVGKTPPPKPQREETKMGKLAKGKFDPRRAALPVKSYLKSNRLPELMTRLRRSTSPRKALRTGTASPPPKTKQTPDKIIPESPPVSQHLQTSTSLPSRSLGSADVQGQEQAGPSNIASEPLPPSSTDDSQLEAVTPRTDFTKDYYTLTRDKHLLADPLTDVGVEDVSMSSGGSRYRGLLDDDPGDSFQYDEDWPSLAKTSSDHVTSKRQHYSSVSSLEQQAVAMDDSRRRDVHKRDEQWHEVSRSGRIPGPQAPSRLPSGSTQTRRLPPGIYCRGSLGHKAIISLRTLEQKVGKFTITKTGDRIKYQPDTTDTHKKLLQHLIDAGAAPYTYSDPTDRNTTVVVYGLPMDTPPEEISLELDTLGFPHARIRRLTPGDIDPEKNGTFAITLPGTSQKADIFKIRYVGRFRVRIEQYRSAAPLQCWRCQGYGHHSGACHRQIRCRKCSGPHWSRDCTKPAEDKPSCPNCTQDHVAGASVCPTRQAYERRHPRREIRKPDAKPNAYRTGAAAPPPSQPRSREHMTQRAPRQPRLFSHVVRPFESVTETDTMHVDGPSEPRQPGGSSFHDLFSVFRELQSAISLIQDFLPTLRSMANRLRTARTRQEKFEAFFTLLCDIFDDGHH